MAKFHGALPCVSKQERKIPFKVGERRHVIVVLLLCEDVRHMDGHRRVFLAVSQSVRPVVLSSCPCTYIRTYDHEGL